MSDSTAKRDCLRCGGPMEAGFLLEKSHAGRTEQTRWVEGRPVFGWFGWAKVDGRRILPVVTHRCERCGWLESHAPPGPPF